MDLRIYPSKTLVLKGCERPLPWISADLSGFNLDLCWMDAPPPFWREQIKCGKTKLVQISEQAPTILQNEPLTGVFKEWLKNTLRNYLHFVFFDLTLY